MLNIEKLRIAVPTEKRLGLDDIVSEVFGQAKTFTIVEVEDAEVRKVEVIDNPASSYPHGAGPVAVKTLADAEVDLVLAREFGLGASKILEHHDIRKISVKPNIKVADSIREALSKSKAEQA